MRFSDKKIAIVVYPLKNAQQFYDLWDSSLGFEYIGFLFGGDKTPVLPPKDLQDKIKLFFNPYNSGYGANLKTILRYLNDMKFDAFIIASPESFTEKNINVIIKRYNSTNGRVIIGTSRSKLSVFPWMINKISGIGLASYAVDIIMSPLSGLNEINYNSSDNDEVFEMDLLLQLRACGFLFSEVELAGRSKPRPYFRYLVNCVKYRLHQLHVHRYNKFIIEDNVRYSFKKGKYSSHVQIIDMISSGTKVLDVGCSQGLLAGPLKDKNVAMVGVDVIPKEFVSKFLSQYHQHDILKLSELRLNREFDYVLFADVLEHLLTPYKILRSARGYLKLDGRLIASTPNIAIWFYRLSLLLGRFEYGSKGVLDNTHVHLYTKASFRKLIERSGYKIVKESFTTLPFEVIFESTGRSRFIKFISWLYYLFVRLWPEMFAYQIVVEAEVSSLEQSLGEGRLNANAE